MRAHCQMVSRRLVVVITGMVTALALPARSIGQELGTLRAWDVPHIVKYEGIGPDRVPTDLNAHSARHEQAMSRSIDYPPSPTRLLEHEPTGLAPARLSICGESIRNPTSILGRASPSSACGNVSEPPNSMAVDIPFRLYSRNLVVVKATIGRTKDVNIIIDTGTNTSVISKKIAKQLRVDRRSESVETLNGTIQAHSLILPDIQMGSFRVISPRLLVHDFTAMERNLGISIGGIVGLDILHLAPFTIDYQKKIVVVGSATALRNTVPFTGTELFLTVRTIVDGQQLRLLLDSGTWELLVFRGRLHVAPNQVDLDPPSLVSTPGGSVQFSWVRTNVSIGTRDLGAHEVAIAETDADPDFDGLLGFAGLGFQEVSFDFEKRLFSWE
jgi:hypothetical protein